MLNTTMEPSISGNSGPGPLRRGELNSSNPEEAAVRAAADFESFLQLLTAQISNQDPLSPLDSTQFVEQLASFSALEQQIQTNNRLEQIADFATGSGRANQGLIGGYAHLIGSHVVTSKTLAQFTGAPVHYSVPDMFRADIASENVALEIQDEDGNTVRRLDEIDGTIVTWDGKKDDGTTADQGTYKLTLTQINAEGQKEIIGRGLILSEVREVHNQDQGALLILENGETAPSDMIEGIVASDRLQG